MGSATIFLDKAWFDANALKFASDFDQVAQKPEDKGTQYMININEMYQSAIVIRNGQLETALALPAKLEEMIAEVEAKPEGKPKKEKAQDKQEEKAKPRSLLYLALTHDLDTDSQQGIAMWLIRRLNRLAGMAHLSLQTDDQPEA
jgi:hypothetical protein